EHPQAPFRGIHVPREELTLRSTEREFEREVMRRRTLRLDEGFTGAEVVQGRGKRGGFHCPLAGQQIEHRAVVALPWVGQEGRRAVEVTDDLEDGILAAGGDHLRKCDAPRCARAR